MALSCPSASPTSYPAQCAGDALGVRAPHSADRAYRAFSLRWHWQQHYSSFRFGLRRSGVEPLGGFRLKPRVRGGKSFRNSPRWLDSRLMHAGMTLRRDQGSLATPGRVKIKSEP